ncbi:structural maintenance of chromosomes protein [Pseudoscourfieldia marina]
MTIQAKQIDARLLGGTARLMMDVVTPNAAAVAAHPSAVDLKTKFERAARYALRRCAACPPPSSRRLPRTPCTACREHSAAARVRREGSRGGGGSSGRAAAEAQPPRRDLALRLRALLAHRLELRFGPPSCAIRERVHRSASHHAAHVNLRSLEVHRLDARARRRCRRLPRRLRHSSARRRRSRRRKSARRHRRRSMPRSMPGWQARCPARLPCRARRQFGDFSRRVGVANIAELEEKHFSQVQEALDAEIAETKKQLAAEQAGRYQPQHHEDARRGDCNEGAQRARELQDGKRRASGG